MTQLRHAAWYLAIIGNIHAAAGYTSSSFVFAALAALFMVASFFERNQ